MNNSFNEPTVELAPSLPCARKSAKIKRGENPMSHKGIGVTSLQPKSSQILTHGSVPSERIATIPARRASSLLFSCSVRRHSSPSVRSRSVIPDVS